MEPTNIFLAIFALIGGFVLLIKGADLFVEGSSSVAKLLKVPSIIIGLTVVALGTSHSALLSAPLAGGVASYCAGVDYHRFGTTSVGGARNKDRNRGYRHRLGGRYFGLDACTRFPARPPDGSQRGGIAICR